MLRFFRLYRQTKDWTEKSDEMLADAGFSMFLAPFVVGSWLLFALALACVLLGYVFFDIIILKILAWMFGLSFVVSQAVLRYIRSFIQKSTKSAYMHTKQRTEAHVRVTKVER